MTPQEIMDGMANKNRQLTMKNAEYMELSEKMAQAKRDYAIAKANRTLELKAEGHSVTLIPTLVAGCRVVADYCYKADVAEGVYRACFESIKDIRSAIDSYRSLLTWMREELHRA